MSVVLMAAMRDEKRAVAMAAVKDALMVAETDSKTVDSTAVTRDEKRAVAMAAVKDKKLAA